MTELTLELGRRRSWRGYTPGRFVKETKGSETTYRHEPAVHKIKVDNLTAKCLQSKSDQWETANRMQKPEGDLVRMIRVSNVKKLPNEPDPPKGMPPQMRVINTIVDRLVEVLKK